MTGPPLVLIGGGARSGKSRFALDRAAALAGEGARGLFIATAEASDDEMRARIEKHRQDRRERAEASSGPALRTVEEPVALPELLASRSEGDRVIVVDCLTLWLSNLLVRDASLDSIEARLGALLAALQDRRAPVIIVSNEVGMALVPETPLGRLFRDLTGFAHQRLAAISDEIYLAAMGTILRLRPSPVELVGR